MSKLNSPLPNYYSFDKLLSNLEEYNAMEEDEEMENVQVGQL